MTTIEDLLGIVEYRVYTGRYRTIHRVMRGFSTDTRSLKKGDVFIALTGEQYNGHAFLEVAAKRRASLAIVSYDWYRLYRDVEFYASQVPMPLLAVDDPLAAYGRIATAHRSNFTYPVIAIAGSNGKTTTKELVADVLATRCNVLRTEGNLNNLIGVPAMMLRMTAEHTAAVIEIGTNTPGEIERLCEILRPTHGLITNIGREHLELLGSIEGVAEEEGALFRYLERTGGTAFVNLDDPHVVRLGRRLADAVTYGRAKRARFVGTVGGLDETGAPSITIADTAKPDAAPIAAQLKTPGLHTAINALAAAAVGITMKAAPTKIRRVLESFTPRTYRAGYARLGAVRAANGARLLNDTYNANPDSVMAALATLKAMKPGRGGRRIAVLAEMKELGASSPQEHARVGRALAGKSGIDMAMFFGAEMRHAHDALTAAPATGVASRYFERKDQLISELESLLTPADIVLVKGSRGMKMEEVVNALVGQAETTAEAARSETGVPNA